MSKYVAGKQLLSTMKLQDDLAMRNGSFSARRWMCDSYVIAYHIKTEFGFHMEELNTKCWLHTLIRKSYILNLDIAYCMKERSKFHDPGKSEVSITRFSKIPTSRNLRKNQSQFLMQIFGYAEVYVT